MNRYLFAKITLLLLVLASQVKADPFNQPGDVQFWQYDGFFFELNPRTTLSFEVESRWGGDISERFLWYIQTFLQVKLCDILYIAPGYRQAYALSPSTREHIPVYSPLLDWTFKFTPKGWTLEDRNRVQYVMVDSGPEVWVYRNRIRIFSPWKLGKMELNPFMFDEVFFREGFGFDENRLAFGGRFFPLKQVGTDLFYMLRYLEFPTWRPIHIMGMYFLFRF